MMRPFPVALAIAVTLGASACALVEGLDHLERVSDLGDGGAADSGAADGRAPSPEGGATTACASRAKVPLFCDDFDVHDLPGLWSTFHQTGGTLAEDNGTSVSAPRSLLEVASPLTTGAYDVSLHSAPIALPAFPASLRFEFQLQPVSFDTTQDAALIVAALDFTNANQDRYSLIFTLFPAGTVLTLSLGEESGLADGGTSYVPHPLPDALPKGGWTRVTLDVVYTDSATATATVSFNGNPELATQALHPTAPDPTHLLVGVGSTYGTVPSLGWTVRYDDVVVDTL